MCWWQKFFQYVLRISSMCFRVNVWVGILCILINMERCVLSWHFWARRSKGLCSCDRIRSRDEFYDPWQHLYLVMQATMDCCKLHAAWLLLISISCHRFRQRIDFPFSTDKNLVPSSCWILLRIPSLRIRTFAHTLRNYWPVDGLNENFSDGAVKIDRSRWQMELWSNYSVRRVCVQ